MLVTKVVLIDKVMGKESWDSITLTIRLLREKETIGWITYGPNSLKDQGVGSVVLWDALTSKWTVEPPPERYGIEADEVEIEAWDVNTDTLTVQFYSRDKIVKEQLLTAYPHVSGAPFVKQTHIIKLSENVEFRLEDWIPCSPLIGPPLPVWLGLTWPWYKEEVPPALM